MVVELQSLYWSKAVCRTKTDELQCSAVPPGAAPPVCFASLCTLPAAIPTWGEWHQMCWRWSVVRGELSCQSQPDFSVSCAELFLIDVSVTWLASDDFLLYLVVIHNCEIASYSPLWGRLSFTER